MTAGLALIEGVEKTNIVVVRNQEQGMGQPRKDPNIIDIDRRENRNCYNCGGFGHIARNYRNRIIGINRRMEIEDSNNLNKDRGLMGSN